MSKLSSYEQTIVNFAHVLQTKPHLLTREIKSSLEDLLKTLPDDVNEISYQITIWNENYPTIEDAIFELPTNSTERGAAGHETKMTPKEAKDLIENAVRQSESSTQTPTNQPQQ